MFKRYKLKSRGPVVYLNRLQKAKMIEAVLQDFLNRSIKGFRILDIGCGNGNISEYFSRNNNQYAVDINDNRNNKKVPFNFFLVDSEKLPFPDTFFDVVLSNHVIEHVVNQDLHLDEIKRVLKPGGICYMATPNKSSPIMEGHVGNNRVLRYKEMAPFFTKHGFKTHEYSVKVVKEPDKFFTEKQYGKFVTLFLMHMLKPLFPSHIFILKAKR